MMNAYLLCFIVVVLPSILLVNGDGAFFSIIASSGQKALTLPNPPTYPNFLTFTPATIGNDYQAWQTTSDGRIINKAWPNLTIDVNSDIAIEGTFVIGFHFKNATAGNVTTTAGNQLWTVWPNGTIQSLIGPGFFLKQSGSQVIISQKGPFQNFLNPPQAVGPLSCTSYGDPHFVRFNGSRYDFQGLGDFILASWGGNILAERQIVCATGITCNRAIAIKAANYASVITISQTVVQVDGTPVKVSPTLNLSPSLTLTRLPGTFPTVVQANISGAIVTFTGFGGSSTVLIVIPSGGALPDGGLCSSICPPNATTQQCGLSWMVNTTTQIFPGGTGQNNATFPPNPNPFVTNNTALLSNASCGCAPLNGSAGMCGSLATACSPYIFAPAWLSSCQSDIIGTGDISFGLASVNAYASICVQNALQSGVSLALPTYTYAATGPGVATAIITAASLSFTIQAYDVLSNPVTFGGDSFNVKSTPNVVSFVVVDNGDGTYSVSYAPVVGTFTITISYCCFSVSYKVTVYPTCGVAVAAEQDVACYSAHTGSFNLTGTGGIPPYYYSINGGAFSKTSGFAGLAAGTYMYSFKDSAICVQNGTVTIAQPASAISVTVVSESDVLCNGASSANFTITASGGTPPYSYSYGSGWASSGAFSGLPAGTYTGQVYDSNLCSASSASVTITEPPAISAITSEAQPTCFGASNGFLTIYPSGGVGTLTYSLDGVHFQSSSTFSGVSGGAKQYWIADSNGCIFSDVVVVDQPPIPTLTVLASANSTCSVINGGSFTYNSSVASSTYSIGGGFQSSGAFKALAAGTYTVTSKTPNGCLASSTLVLSRGACPPKPVLCTSYGDPHLTRFDGALFDLFSTGDFTLAQWSGNLVQSRQYLCKPGIACNQKLAVQVSGFSSVIIIDNNAVVTVGGVVTTIKGTVSLSTSPPVSIVKNADRTYTVYFSGANVVYTGFVGAPNFGITVAVGSAVTGGLCYADGVAPTHAGALQWKVNSTSTPASLFAGTIASNDTGNYGPYPTNNTGLQSSAASACAPLSPSGALALSCSAFFAPDGYYATCYNDVIVMEDPGYAQSSIAAFVQQCANAAGANASSIVFPTSPFYSVISGNGLNVAPYYPSTSPLQFSIQSKDALGNNILVGGDVYVVTATGPASLTFTIVDLGNGNYTVSYVAAVSGVYTITVKLAGGIVGSSPYTITISTSATFSLVYGTKAITYTGASTVLLLATQTANNLNQQWYFVGQRIVTAAVTNMSMDVSSDKAAEGTRVIGFHYKDGSDGNPVPNQQWSLFPNGTAICLTTSNYYIKPSGTTVQMSFTGPTLFSIQVPL